MVIADKFLAMKSQTTCEVILRISARKVKNQAARIATFAVCAIGARMHLEQIAHPTQLDNSPNPAVRL